MKSRRQSSFRVTGVPANRAGTPTCISVLERLLPERVWVFKQALTPKFGTNTEFFFKKAE